MRLNEWQRAFESYLLGEQATANSALARTLTGGPTLDVETGLAIYHNAYQARLQDVLRDDFPAIRHWLGDAEFDQLTAQYVRQNPSAHYSLRWLGSGFEAFIRIHLVEAQGAPLAELAHLEWAFTLAFDAAEHEPLTMESMASLSPEEWPALQLGFRPCVQWLECGFNSVALWRSVKDGTEFPGRRKLDAPQVVVVWRAGLICHYRSLPPDEAWALSGMVKEGWNFAELCAQLTVNYGEGAPLQAVTWLKQWVYDSLLLRRDS
ncbi:DNA-binding domain-containing protein [Pseudomonas sp. Irchel s3h17]|uniref:HvfC/BufC N-terminal domain-containing protein n=1 Tax=Pseudomonas sp. Irchel s3h17 TaxID=2009182 RepID=UPI000BA37423|nr:DNA-binding domain-containing protein [Pseudomonas sp. Irchel s3h17]